MKRLSFEEKAAEAERLLRLMLRQIPKNAPSSVWRSRRQMIRRALHETELVRTSIHVYGADGKGRHPAEGS